MMGASPQIPEPAPVRAVVQQQRDRGAAMGQAAVLQAGSAGTRRTPRRPPPRGCAPRRDSYRSVQPASQASPNAGRPTAAHTAR